MRHFGHLTSRQRLALAATVTATAVLFSSLTSVVVALPAIQRDLGLDSSQVHWVIVAALLPLCAVVVVSGRLGDVLGRRRVFGAGMLCFAAGSALCALAASGDFLVAARVVQGLGVALAVPLALANLTTALPERHRGWAIGVQTGVSTGFGILAPLVVALFAQYGSWRWAFAVNVPAALAVVAGVRRYVRESRGRAGTKVHAAACALLGSGLTVLVFAWERSSQWGLASADTLGVMGVGVVLLALFCVTQLRTADPLLDVRPLRRPAVAAPLIALAVVQCASLAVTVYVTLYLQHVRDLGALQAGLFLVCTNVATLALAPAVGRLTGQGHGMWLIVTGLAVMGASVLWLAHGLEHRQLMLLVPALLVVGMATPLVYPSSAALIIDALPAGARGVGASLSVQSRQIGGTLGLALVNASVTSVEWRRRSALLTGPDAAFTPQEHRALDAALSREPERGELLARLPEGARDAVVQAADEAFVRAVAFGFTVLGGCLLVAALAAFGFLCAGGRRTAARQGKSAQGDQG
ncbi:MFS transporter [Streptomyces sp. NPDC085932]|uniref:MFS transporter n=1 Tax=Streptomyces sp. NPDC085932 TaxID=3365741 RepID=UPI0037D5538C